MVITSRYIPLIFVSLTEAAELKCTEAAREEQLELHFVEKTQFIFRCVAIKSSLLIRGKLV